MGAADGSCYVEVFPRAESLDSIGFTQASRSTAHPIIRQQTQWKRQSYDGDEVHMIAGQSGGACTVRFEFESDIDVNATVPRLFFGLF